LEPPTNPARFTFYVTHVLSHDLDLAVVSDEEADCVAPDELGHAPISSQRHSGAG